MLTDWATQVALRLAFNLCELKAISTHCYKGVRWVEEGAVLSQPHARRHTNVIMGWLCPRHPGTLTFLSSSSVCKAGNGCQTEYVTEETCKMAGISLFNWQGRGPVGTYLAHISWVPLGEDQDKKRRSWTTPDLGLEHCPNGQDIIFSPVFLPILYPRIQAVYLYQPWPLTPSSLLPPYKTP